MNQLCCLQIIFQSGSSGTSQPRLRELRDCGGWGDVVYTLKHNSHERCRQFSVHVCLSLHHPPQASGATQTELDHNVRPDRDKAPCSELERLCAHQGTDALAHPCSSAVSSSRLLHASRFTNSGCSASAGLFVAPQWGAECMFVCLANTFSTFSSLSSH